MRKIERQAGVLELCSFGCIHSHAGDRGLYLLGLDSVQRRKEKLTRHSICPRFITPYHAYKGNNCQRHIDTCCGEDHHPLLYPDLKMETQGDSAKEDGKDRDHFRLMHLEAFTIQKWTASKYLEEFRTTNMDEDMPDLTDSEGKDTDNESYRSDEDSNDS